MRRKEKKGKDVESPARFRAKGKERERSQWQCKSRQSLEGLGKRTEKRERRCTKDSCRAVKFIQVGEGGKASGGPTRQIPTLSMMGGRKSRMTQTGPDTL